MGIFKNGTSRMETSHRNKNIVIILILALTLCCINSKARAQFYPANDPKRFTQVKSWKGTFNASLPSTVSQYSFQGDSYYCTYTQTRNWTVNGQCTLDLDHNISPPDTMVATWTGTGALTGSYKDVIEVECAYADGCQSWTETEESSELELMDPIDDYYFLDISYQNDESYGTYHFVTQNVTFITNTSDTCSGSNGESIAAFGPYETDWYEPLPSSGMTLSGSITNVNASFYGIDNLLVPFNWTLVPNSKQDSSLKITKLKQLFSAKPGAETDFVFHNGKLVFTAEAKVTPVNMVEQIKWDVPTIGNESDRKIQVTNNPLTGVSRLVVTYKKLPENNDDFGSKKLTANIPDIDMSDSKDFRVFFERDRTDHPDSGSGSEKSANWYYYWSKGPVPKLDQFTYENSDRGGYYDWSTGTLTIGKTAASVPIASMSQPLTDKKGTHSFTLDREHAEGIQAVSAIVAHELRHKYLVERAKYSDQDGDMVRYEEEEGVEPWTNYEDPNTYGLNAGMFFGNTQTYINTGGPWWKRRQRSTEISDAEEQLASAGDNEIKAIFAEKSRVCDPSKDWAWPGSQTGQ